MKSKELSALISQADSCYHNGDYAREAQLRLQICIIEPENPYYKHNLALALRNNDRLDFALELFSQLANEHPHLSRVHNNLATTLVRMGADLNDVAPVFMRALSTSDNVDDFRRHFLNTCGTIAYGMDEDAEKAFRIVEDRFPEILKNIPRPIAVEKNMETMEGILAAYREIAAYRQAFSQRKWYAAEIALNKAKEKLAKLDLHSFISSIDKHVIPCFLCCRDIIGVLEEIAVGGSLSPKAALNRYEILLQTATSLAENGGPYSFQTGLLNMLRLFLTGMIQTLRFFDHPIGQYASNKSIRRELADRTPSAYLDLARDLASLLRFLDAQGLELAEQTGSMANKEVIYVMRDECWLKVALFIRGLAMNFRGVDVGLARSLLDLKYDPLEYTKYVLRNFKSYIERQSYKDMFVAGRPQENIARALLQAYLSSRSYREIPVRGGFSDLLLFSRDGRFLYETKIWRGIEYHNQGVREIAEYVTGEDDDSALLGIFYVVFDGTRRHQAQSQFKGAYSTVTVGNRQVEVIVVSLVPPKPSTKKQ